MIVCAPLGKPVAPSPQRLWRDVVRKAVFALAVSSPRCEVNHAHPPRDELHRGRAHPALRLARSARRNGQRCLKTRRFCELGALALIGWCAHCGPLATFRPIAALSADRPYELGLGTVAVSPRPYVDERWGQSGQLWFTKRANDWLQLSAIAAFDPGALGAGIGATAAVVRGRRVVAGVEGEAGYGWAAASVPFAFRLFEESWLYAAPRVYNFGIYPAVGTPIGLSLHIQKGAFLRFEYQASWMQLQAYNLRHHIGGGLAVQW